MEMQIFLGSVPIWSLSSAESRGISKSKGSNARPPLPLDMPLTEETEYHLKAPSITRITRVRVIDEGRFIVCGFINDASFI